MWVLPWFSNMFFSEKLKPVDCAYDNFCTYKKGLTCATFTDMDGFSLEDDYCAQDKCEKDEDCTTLDDKKLKHKPGKCEKKKCKYDFFVKRS